MNEKIGYNGGKRGEKERRFKQIWLKLDRKANEIFTMDSVVSSTYDVGSYVLFFKSQRTGWLAFTFLRSSCYSGPRYPSP